jgi:hypothetical protein
MTPSQSQADETTAAAGVHRFPLRYKTTLCVNFTTKGSCPRGQACLYAHGEGELRTIVENRISRSLNAAKSPTTPARTDQVLEELRVHRSAASVASAVTARRKVCVQLIRRTLTSSEAPNSKPRPHSAPQRDPYSAMHTISLVPRCDA